MTDLENREAFETWYIENYHDGDIFPNNRILNFNGHHNEYRDSSLNMLWDSWQASSQRQGFKLVPLEPSEEMIDCVYDEDGDYVASIDGSPESFYKAMINAV